MPDGYVVCRRRAADIDTDVISYLLRDDSRAERYRPILTDALLAVSFMTIAELDRWALSRNWGDVRQDRMEAFLEYFTVVLVDRTLCRTWAEVTNGARQAGRPIQAADGWIAATALSLGVPLVTNNRAHYAGVEGLAFAPEDPFE